MGKLPAESTGWTGYCGEAECPVGIAVVAVAPAGHFELLKLSGFGRPADPELVEPLVESESGSAPLAADHQMGYTQ